METIHYISDFTYFSGKKVNTKYGNILNVIREHIRYIGRKAEGVFTFNLDVNEWIGRAKTEIKKRWDSRVALKFVMALPLETNEKNVNKMAEMLQNFISEKLNVDKENVSIAIHLHRGISGNYNPHAHILIYPRDKNGKKLRLNRKDLSEFHRAWDKLLREIGAEIKKDPEDLRIPHLGQKLYYDPETQELYKTYREVKRLIAKTKTINHRREEGNEEKEGRELEIKEGVKDFFNKFLNNEDKEFRDKQRKALALHFYRLGYSPNDKIAIVLVNHKTNDVLQRVFTVREILSDKILRFLSAKNSEGYSVYASVNVLKDTAKRRRKDDFKTFQKRIYLDLDSKNLDAKKLIYKLYRYIELKQLPPPTHIVKSSKGNYQIYWTLENEENYKVLEGVMEQMNVDLELDHTQDVSRVFRLPYFRNKKIGKDDLVVNIKSLAVFNNKGEKIDEIKVSGKPVSNEPFIALLKEPSLTPKPLAIKHEPKIANEINDFWKRVEEGRKKERVRKYVEEGYSKEVAEYRLMINSLLDELKIKDVELLNIINQAFKRNKTKTPSEVDMSMFSLLYAMHGGEPPKKLKGTLLDLLYIAAAKRGKDDYYVDRTYMKVKGYWDLVNSERNNNNRGNDWDKDNNDWDNDLDNDNNDWDIGL